MEVYAVEKAQRPSTNPQNLALVPVEEYWETQNPKRKPGSESDGFPYQRNLGSFSEVRSWRRAPWWGGQVVFPQPGSRGPPAPRSGLGDPRSGRLQDAPRPRSNSAASCGPRSGGWATLGSEVELCGLVAQAVRTVGTGMSGGRGCGSPAAGEAAPRPGGVESARLRQSGSDAEAETSRRAPRPDQAAGAPGYPGLRLSPPSATSTVSSPCSGPLGPSPGPPKAPSWREPIKAGPCDPRHILQDR
nr:translation initiation factor IF-2-like [Peromyscus maniculatus bairdii]